MRKAFLACLGSMGLVLAATSVPAQISTFPSPPPLAPSKDDSDQSTTAPSAPVPPAAPAAPTAPATPSPETQPITPTPDTMESGNPAPTAPAANNNPAGPVSASMLTSMSALDDKIPLQPGDRISFRVIEDRDDPVPRIVTDTGEVDFPYIGRVKVQGRTCHQVAQQVKQLLEVDYYKRATVIIGLDTIFGRDTTQPKDLAWVVGQVRQVGPVELSSEHPMTVSQLILRAGGFGDFADQRRVRVIHRAAIAGSASNGESSAPVPPAAPTANDLGMEVVDVKAVFDGQSNVDPIVKPNDYIIVPKRLVNF